MGSRPAAAGLHQLLLLPKPQLWPTIALGLERHWAAGSTNSMTDHALHTSPPCSRYTAGVEVHFHGLPQLGSWPAGHLGRGHPALWRRVRLPMVGSHLRRRGRQRRAASDFHVSALAFAAVSGAACWSCPTSCTETCLQVGFQLCECGGRAKQGFDVQHTPCGQRQAAQQLFCSPNLTNKYY